MTDEVITAINIPTVPYETLIEFVKDIYQHDVPEFAVDKTHHLSKLEEDLIFFSNNYAFVMELWAIMISRVRKLRNEKADRKLINEAMDKRDYLDKVLATIKLKYHAVSRLMQFYKEPDYHQGF